MVCISWWTGLSKTITTTPAAALNAWRRPRLQISNANKNWSELCLNLSLSCPLTHAPTMGTPLALNSALNWKQYWAPGLQNEFVYDYSCPGALRALGNVYFIELGCILFSFPLPFMSVLAQGWILIEMVWLSYKASITYRSRQPHLGWQMQLKGKREVISHCLNTANFCWKQCKGREGGGGEWLARLLER